MTSSIAVVPMPATGKVELGQQAPPPEGYSVALFQRYVAAMEARLDQMTKANDARAVFQLTYLAFSRRVFEALETGEFHDTAWVIDMCCRFVEVYEHQLVLFERRDPSQCRPWRVVFEGLEEGRLNTLQAMLMGMNAHINYDLAFVTLGACRYAGDLDQGATSARALAASRSGVPVVRYRDFLLINRIAWHALPSVQDTVLGRFNRFLHWGNRLTLRMSRFVGERLLVGARDASWCQTTLLIHARTDAERVLVARVIDAYATSVADIIGTMTLRPDHMLASAASWSRRWERLDPELQTGLVTMACENPVVAELALRELAFAGAEPISVLETLLRRGERRLAGVFGRMFLQRAPRERRQRLVHFLERRSGPTGSAIEITEALLAAGEPAKGLPQRAVEAVRERWRSRIAAARRARAELEPDDTRLAAALEAYALESHRQLVKTGSSVSTTMIVQSPSSGGGRAALATHPDRWIQLLAGNGDAMESLVERVLFLKDTSVFMEVDPTVLVHVAEQLEARSYRTGANILTAGKPGEGLVLVRSGQLEISQLRGEERVRIATLGPHDSVGELSTLNDTPATADCIALTDLEAYVVPADVLAELLHQHPRLAIGLLRMLSQRLIATTRRVV